MVNCINLIIEMSPRFLLGRENVPCVAEVVNRSLKADCTDFTSCSLGITHTNFKQTFWLCSAATNDVIRLFSPTNNQLHITHVAYQYQSKSFNLTPPFAFTNFTKKHGISIFRMNQSKPIFAKTAPIKKLTTKISRQTEFTMSRRLSAHNNN